MKKFYISLSLLLLCCFTAVSQQSGVDRVIVSIEENNAALKALRYECNAERYSNKIGSTLPNPEAELEYMWGRPAEAGSKKTILVTQEFDFQTILGYKGGVADRKNDLVDIRYKSERIKLLTEAKKYCYLAIYYNASISELKHRLDYARLMADAFSRKLEVGDAGILDYNKALLNLSIVNGKYKEAEIARREVFSNLARLNGGEEVLLVDSVFDNNTVLPDFDIWYAQAESKNPILEYAKSELSLRREETLLSKSAWAPTIKAGYSAELEKVNKYHGISVGLSIPLWADKGRIRQAREAVKASESREEEVRIDLFYKIKTVYDKTSALQKSAVDMKNSVKNLSGTELLAKALDNGQISLLDYIVESSLYYDAREQMLSLERDFYISLSDLSAFTL